jgi:4-amino-4-deoxy-L-arabinose transferase-like glycosyltransferase
VQRNALWAVAIVAIIVAIVHLATAGRYDIFRNELYFIVCGWHPAFGYVDQPPIVPLLAAFTQLGGIHVWALRLPAILAAIATVPVVVAFTQLLGGNGRAAWLAAVAYASATLVTAMSATLNTSSFEPFDFTLVAYLVTRAFVRNQPRMYWWAGLVAGLAFQTRYGILMWAAAMAIGLLICGPRSVFRSRDLWIGIAIAVVIALPNVIWQAAYGFPFLELVRNDNSGNFLGGPIGFVIGQFFLINIVLAPLIIAGIIVPFTVERLQQFRFLAVTFVVMALLILITNGKAYYMAGAYPTILALGAVSVMLVWRWVIAVWAVLATANAFLALPYVLPTMPIAQLKFIIDHSAFKVPPMERAGIGAPVMQVYDDEFGWRDLAQIVGGVYASLPASDRDKAEIYASNYGDASAVNVFGKNLPFVVSGNNQYYLWGPGNGDGSVVIAINVDPAQWSPMCDSAHVVARTTSNPYAMPYEVNQPIVLCRGLHPPLQAQWPSFRHIGIENLGVGRPR